MCALYRIPCFRLHSRVFTVPGIDSRDRIMQFGRWRDDKGKAHNKGMTDLIAFPICNVLGKNIENLAHALGVHTWDRGDDGYGGEYIADAKAVEALKTYSPLLRPFPLWIECKSGRGELTEDQQAFKEYVECNGMYFLECHDSANALIEWLKSHGVTR